MEFIILIGLIVIVIYLNLSTVDSSKKIIDEVIKEVEKFYLDLDRLKHKYVNDSEYSVIKQKYKKAYDTAKKSKNKKNIKFCEDYENLEDYIKEINNKFPIFEKETNNTVDKRSVVVVNDNSLSITESDKTSTVIEKVKYLIEKKNINPENIMLISFTDKATSNIKNKLNIENVECTTFHKLGMDGSSKSLNKKDIDNKSMNVAINQYIKEELPKKKEDAIYFVKFMSLYLYAPRLISDKLFGKKKEKESNKTKSKFKKVKEKLITLKNEKVKNYEELAIANYLFINGINYVYEMNYEHDVFDKNRNQYRPTFYLTDYKIYLEHFSVNKAEEKHKEEIKSKKKIHDSYKTKLIETYSYYFSDETIFSKLDEKLKSNGVEFIEVDHKILLATILNKKDKEELELLNDLVEGFIKKFEENNYDIDMLDKFIKEAKKKYNISEQMLLQLSSRVYKLHQDNLSLNNRISFSDSIKMKTRKISNVDFDRKIDYIIIDESKDVSFSKYLLVKEIQKKFNCKVISVDNSWNGILRFPGSDFELFIDFKKYFDDSQKSDIKGTIFNSRHLIDDIDTMITEKENEKAKQKMLKK